jgi:DME family drug/metabolite transporter
VLFALTPPAETLRALRHPGAWLLLIGVGVGPSLLAPICFTLGLQRVRASSASILATIEPVVAAGLAWAVLGESLAPLQLAGGMCVLLAVLLLVTARGSQDRAAATPSTALEQELR